MLPSNPLNITSFIILTINNIISLSLSQIGAYFGAEVCVVDLDGDSNTDLILASAPMHTEGGREGKVFVYKLTKEV